MPKSLRFLALVLLASPGGALETDQYLAWRIELADSAAPINDFVNHHVAVAVERANREPGTPTCPEVTVRAYRRLFPSILHSRLRGFLANSDEVERHPGDEVSYWGYLGDSVFQQPAFPFILPMARTIRVGERSAASTGQLR